ncbi:hypothetical protein BU17DRAFT_67649 [Hysterangium stoloniferum]|nr:hypothetical protein BU17DRAFT_67649 [Hysterangium stoloniferum]
MWSVKAYARMPPPNNSDITLSTIVRRPLRCTLTRKVPLAVKRDRAGRAGGRGGLGVWVGYGCCSHENIKEPRISSIGLPVLLAAMFLQIAKNRQFLTISAKATVRLAGIRFHGSDMLRKVVQTQRESSEDEGVTNNEVIMKDVWSARGDLGFLAG